MRPLDRISSIKVKLGVVILAATGIAVLVIVVGEYTDVRARFSAVLAGVLALGVVQILAHGMIFPLREMADATKAMARGEYDRRVTATSRDEVGDLARAFNAMAGELAEVERLRRDLVANASHELRTPITALRAMLENLVDGVEQPDPEVLASMLGEVMRMGRLVTQLLDLSRLEAGVTPLERSEFAVAPLLEDVARDFKTAVPLAAISVVVDPPALSCDGDRERIVQVVTNLLENAVRYSPPRGTVEIRARSISPGAGLHLEVLDEGPGIAKAEVDRVFERFYRTDDARASRDGGSGLGLAIVRWIVDLHGGEIRPEQREPKGCAMIVEIPSPSTTVMESRR